MALQLAALHRLASTYKGTGRAMRDAQHVRAVEANASPEPHLCKYISTAGRRGRLEGLDAGTTEARAGQLLHGLDFTKAMQAKKVLPAVRRMWLCPRG